MVPQSSQLQLTSSSSTQGVEPIILQPCWLCNKAVGELLAPSELHGGGRFEQTEKYVKQLILQAGCPKEFVKAILGYIQRLELCFITNGNQENAKVFFPAVASNKEMEWPLIFHQLVTIDDGIRIRFYGRRIKCKDTEKHLIPSGVFSRLQVKLQSLSNAASRRTYKIGFHWCSFVKHDVGVMVRFGRMATNQHQSSTRPIHNASTSMEEDDHPKWIDILVACHPQVTEGDISSQIYSRNSILESKESEIMNEIKGLIFNICQATNRGIPTVLLEEMVLKSHMHPNDDVIALADVHESIRSDEGIATNLYWKDQTRTPVTDLLLPHELRYHLLNHVQAIEHIQAEFADGSNMPYTDQQKRKGIGSSDVNMVRALELEDIRGDQLYPQLQGQHKVLFDLIYQLYQRLDAKGEEILVLVKDIKQDIKKIVHGLQLLEANIVANCSTRLLTQLLVGGALPRYPYLTNKARKMEKVKAFLRGQEARIHFLCESLEGPHVVERQQGKDVVVEAGILAKLAPYLVPTLRVLGCASKLFLNAYLPGIAPLCFQPLFHILECIGITADDLKAEIMPKILDILFEGVEVGIEKLYNLRVTEEKRKDVKEAIQRFMGHIEDLDMNRDFALQLVQVENEAL
ncbi:hypothetical protein L7F22_002226 [Adiantum nelumboides]|nr:hypothetical protein [Adiantum nelumboides]